MTNEGSHVLIGFLTRVVDQSSFQENDIWLFLWAQTANLIHSWLQVFVPFGILEDSHWYAILSSMEQKSAMKYIEGMKQLRTKCNDYAIISPLFLGENLKIKKLCKRHGVSCMMNTIMVVENAFWVPVFEILALDFIITSANRYRNGHNDALKTDLLVLMEMEIEIWAWSPYT